MPIIPPTPTSHIATKCSLVRPIGTGNVCDRRKTSVLCGNRIDGGSAYLASSTRVPYKPRFVNIRCNSWEEGGKRAKKWRMQGYPCILQRMSRRGTCRQTAGTEQLPYRWTTGKYTWTRFAMNTANSDAWDVVKVNASILGLVMKIPSFLHCPRSR